VLVHHATEEHKERTVEMGNKWNTLTVIRSMDGTPA
jgi:hypothetical protein